MSIKVRKIKKAENEFDGDLQPLEPIETEEEETPAEYRTRLRAGNGKLEHTSGVCPGFQTQF